MADSKYTLEEKNMWLDKYLPEIDMSHRIFPPCGSDKKEYIPSGIRKNDYLIDDYTHNLTLWSPPAQGIKILNGINHTNRTWKGSRLSLNKAPKELSKDIANIVMHNIEIRDAFKNVEMSKKSINDIKTTLEKYKNVDNKQQPTNYKENRFDR